MNNPLAPEAIDAVKAAMKADAAAAELAKPKKRRACTSCLRDFRYGEIVMRPVVEGSKEILCEGCARRERKKGEPMHAVVFGGGQASTVARERAAKSLKKLNRFQKAVAREQRIAANGGKNKRR